jgi:hypothetical protein
VRKPHKSPRWNSRISRRYLRFLRFLSLRYCEERIVGYLRSGGGGGRRGRGLCLWGRGRGGGGGGRGALLLR